MVGITLGIESTAHTAAVGIISSDGKILADEKSIYTPEKGSGIHPREAGRHHAEALPKLITDALLSANLSSSDISLVSFARGPGLGPCLRTGATAARSFGHKLNIPIIGILQNDSTVEGGDCLWINEKLLLIGVSRRTTAS